MTKPFEPTRRRLSFAASATFVVLMLLAGLAAKRAGASPVRESCAANAQSRQLDFWLGEWSVSDGENPATATSKVSLELGECLIVERWSDPAGNQGENFFGYNVGDKTWSGMFADNRGQIHIFVRGKVAGGRAEFYGPSLDPHGATILNRIMIVRLSLDKVAQAWQQSANHGATWTTVFHGEYSRAKSE